MLEHPNQPICMRLNQDFVQTMVNRELFGKPTWNKYWNNVHLKRFEWNNDVFWNNVDAALSKMLQRFKKQEELFCSPLESHIMKQSKPAHMSDWGL